jgi:hypothetical protein
MESETGNAVSPGPYSIDPHQWVAKYADYLYRYAITRIDDEELARDLVQESTWLIAILKNK